MFSLQKLPSGLPILTAPIEGTASVTVLIFAGAGSRYEKQEERGISHFLEHMFFKGGQKYKNTKEVSAAIDGIGGDFNAFTGKEYAGYYVKVAATHVSLACDVLSDMLLHASFPEEEIDKERGVIIEEERMYQDTPMYRAGWDFEELIFGNHPLGWDTIGTDEVIMSVKQADFRKHERELYTPDNMMIAFSGNITPTQSLKLSEEYFGAISGSKSRNYIPLETYGKEKLLTRKKETEQSHLVIGVPGVPATDPDHFTQKLLAIVLGGNMSSRMFLNIREAKGLCYYISTEVDSYMDAAAVSTRAGVDQNRLSEAVKLIKEEYEIFRKDGVTEEELNRAKEYLKGKITLNLEDSEERAHFYGKQLLLYGKSRSIAEYFREIDAVTKEKMDTLAQKILKPEELRLVVIGKEAKGEKFEDLI